MQSVGTFFHFFGYVFPMILLIGAYLLAPTLRYTVFNTIPQSESSDFYISLIVDLMLAIIWVIADMIVISRTLISGPRLIENAMVSMIMGFVFLGVIVHMYDTGALAWLVLIPGLAAIIDAFVTVYIALNQALLKRLLQETGADH